MRKLSVLLFLSVLLGALLGSGCHRNPVNADGQLIALDSLSAVSPDSALSLLQRVDTATLSESDLAYYSLLTTQSMFRAGIPVTDSATIARAWRYFKNHGPHDRQIRTLTFYGDVAEGMGCPKDAMRWYKRGELAAREQDDSLNVCYALMAIGELYKYYFDDSLAVARFRQSLDYVPAYRPDIKEFCFTNLSLLYQNNNGRKDSAAFYVQALKELVLEHNDSTMMPWATLTETSKLFYDSCFAQAKELAVANIRSYPDYIPFVGWTYASQSYTHLGMADSAEYYLHAAPPPASAADSSDYFYTQSLICGLKNEWKEAIRYELLSDSIVEGIRFNSDRKLLSLVEKETELQVEREHSRFSWHLLFAMVALLIALALTTVSTYRHRKERRDLIAYAEWIEKDYRQQLESLRKEKKAALQTAQSSAGSTDTEFLESLYSKLSAKLEKVLQSLGGMAKDFYVYGQNAEVFVKKFQKRMETTMEDKELWDHMESYINQTRGNALKHFFAAHPSMNVKNRRLVMLSILGFDSASIAACLGYNGPKVVSAIRSRMKKDFGINGDMGHYLVEHYAEST